MRRVLMGVMKDRHGTYHAQQKVPKRLQAAVARVLDQGKDSQSYLKRSLGTKNLKAANILAKPVLAGFDRVFGEAEQLLAARPMRESLSATEIKRLAEIYYASKLDTDETVRREGTGSEPLFQSIAAQLTAAGVNFKTPFAIGALPEAGLSEREVYKRAEHLSWELSVTSDGLARGNTAIIREELDELLYVYQISLDPKCEAYRRLAMAVLSAHVKALKDIERRNGESLSILRKYRRCSLRAELSVVPFATPLKAGIRNGHDPLVRFTNISALWRCSFNCTATCLWPVLRNLT